MSNTNYQASVIGTVNNGQVSISYNGQIQDQWSGDIITPNDTTYWSLGSCTKSFTATLLGQMVNQGHLTASSLVLPLIQQYLPAGKIPEALHTITLEQLATMTAGLPGDNFKGVGSGPISEVATLFNALTKPDNYNANMDFDYSNMGYALLSYATVACGGLPLPTNPDFPTLVQWLFQQNIFNPLGMSSAGFYPPAQQPGFYLPYGNLANGSVVDGSKPDWPAYDGAGALYMTAPDLMRWLQANMAGNLPDGGTGFVQSNPVSTMQSTGATWPEGQYITRGWFTNSFKGPQSGNNITMVTKNGDIPGFHCGIGFQQPASPGATSDFGVFVAYNYESKTIPALELALDNMING